ncbi:hypothetical protein J6590_065011 [Homalodisca vitripennis]|nr:hypothetical protein J6590_065011 [Homalodisca vitripennis]
MMYLERLSLAENWLVHYFKSILSAIKENKCSKWFAIFSGVKIGCLRSDYVEEGCVFEVCTFLSQLNTFHKTFKFQIICFLLLCCVLLILWPSWIRRTAQVVFQDVSHS